MLRHSAWLPPIHICLCVFGVLMTSTSLMAQSSASLRAAATAFRVDTDIFLKVNNNKPDKQTLTLFKEGVYYDFAMDDSGAITIVDPLGGRIVMLSPNRQVKTSIQTADLSASINKLQQNITNNDLSKMLSAAKQVTFDSQTNLLRVGDEALAYEATLQSARDASMATQYADFADWSARLNTILPPHFPPFVRFELNRQIASRGALPDTILRLTKHDGHASAVKAKLLVVASLSRDDETKIQAAGEMLQKCKDVSQTEFFAAKPPLVGSATTPGSGVRK